MSKLIDRILDEFKDINYAYNDATRLDTLSIMLDELVEQAAPRWHRGEDELPDRCDAYVVGWRYPNGCFYWGKVLFFNDKWQVDEEIPTPDYWMPIPEPPKEDA